MVVVSTIGKPHVPERAQMSAAAPGTAPEYSRGPGASRGGVPVPPALWRALALAAFVGAILLVVADFTTLFEARGVGFSRHVPGHRNHSYAMVVIGGVALVMALLAMRSQSRSALAALAMLGLVAIVIALGFDLPDATGIATLRSFQDARLAPRTGFYLETLGAALVAVAAVGGLLLASPSRDRRPARR